MLFCANFQCSVLFKVRGHLLYSFTRVGCVGDVAGGWFYLVRGGMFVGGGMGDGGPFKVACLGVENRFSTRLFATEAKKITFQPTVHLAIIQAWHFCHHGCYWFLI